MSIGVQYDNTCASISRGRLPIRNCTERLPREVIFSSASKWNWERHRDGLQPATGSSVEDVVDGG